LLALNPIRAAFGIPRAGPPAAASRPVELALLGGAAGAVLVLVASALADPVLDAVHVSDSSFRVAAGLVALIAGIADLVRRPPRPEPAPSGRRAWLVPVAVPLVARPALIVLALGAGADRGLAPAAIAMAIGVAALAALTAAGATEGRRARLLRLFARLLGAGLVAGGVFLAIAGVLDL